METEKVGTLGSRVASGAFWSAVSRVSLQTLSFASAALVARKLNPGVYGVMNMAQIVIALVSLFRDLGLASAVVQRREIDDAFLSSLFWVSAAVGVAASLVCAAAAPFAAAFYHQPEVGNLLRVLAISFAVTNLAAVQAGLMVRRMQFQRIAIVEITAASTGLGFAIVLAYSGYGVWSLAASALANAVVSTAGLLLLCGWRPAMSFSWTHIRGVTRFGAALSGFNLLNFFARNADNILIGRYLGASPLGFYQFAYTVMLYPVQNIAQLLGRVLFPAFAELQHDTARFRQAYLRSCAVIAFISFPLMAGVAALADPFVLVWLGPKWMPVAPILKLLAPVAMLQALGTTTGQIYTAKGRTDLLFRWGLAACPLIVCGFAAGLPWGIRGVAIAYSIVTALQAYPLFRIPFRLIGLSMREFWAVIRPYLFGSAVMFLAVTGVRIVLSPLPAVAILAAGVCCGAGVYFAMAMLFRFPAVAEVTQALQQLRRKDRVREATDRKN